MTTLGVLFTPDYFLVPKTALKANFEVLLSLWWQCFFITLLLVDVQIQKYKVSDKKVNFYYGIYPVECGVVFQPHI